jgi:hypothetical protein
MKSVNTTSDEQLPAIDAGTEPETGLTVATAAESDVSDATTVPLILGLVIKAISPRSYQTSSSHQTFYLHSTCKPYLYTR